MAAAGDARVLVLGGCGFIGRNLVHYLVENSLASYVRVADKVFPSTAYLNEAHTATFESDKVEFVQSNLVNEGSIAKAFDGGFDVVFNCAAETKYGQDETVYKQKVLDLACMVAAEAAAQNVGKFVYVSTAQVYKADSKSKDETAAIEPWTHLAQYSYEAENALLDMEGLNVVIARPAIVYGPGDIGVISSRLICGAVYKHLGEDMKILWTTGLKTNTVHVLDVVAALWQMSQTGENGEIYNLVDKGQTDQGKVNGFISDIFGIKVKTYGTVVSNLARVDLAGAAETANDKHLAPWSELCTTAGVENTPLTPYLDLEVLRNNALCINGDKIESIGFTYQYPEMTEALLREQLDYFVSQGVFPAQVLE